LLEIPPIPYTKFGSPIQLKKSYELPVENNNLRTSIELIPKYNGASFDARIKLLFIETNTTVESDLFTIGNTESTLNFLRNISSIDRESPDQNYSRRMTNVQQQQQQFYLNRNIPLMGMPNQEQKMQSPLMRMIPPNIDSRFPVSYKMPGTGNREKEVT